MMKKNITLLLVSCLIQVTNAQLMQGHKIDDQNRVTFTVEAPNAKEVKVINLSDSLAMGAPEYNLQKNADGKWTATSQPCRTGFHYYQLEIDGFKAGDPASQHYFGWGKWISGLEIPPKDIDYYLPKANIQRGEVRYHYFMSDVTGTYRKCIVYTPPGYDQGNKSYPVLYLQHGAGESELGWTMQGKANIILDNLIAEGKATPMIIVMNNGYAARVGAENTARPRRDNNVFKEFLLTDVIPMIEKNYRTLKGKENRAIAGLSMGAGQAMRIGLENPELFGSIGSFSGGSRNFDLDTSYQGAFKNAEAFNKNNDLLWIGCGQLDFLWEHALGLHKKLEKGGIEHIWDVSAGSHEWQVWRHHLYEFAQVVFR